MSADISLHKTSLQGHRPTNEDAECYKINLSANGTAIDAKYAPVNFFAICDGHGGSTVAEFVIMELKKQFIVKNNVFPVPDQTIKKIYNHIQKKLILHPNRIADRCGCTSIVMIQFLNKIGNDGPSGKTQNKCLQVINLGDCRAVLSRQGLAIPLTKDHKPFWSDEKKRITEVNKKSTKKRQVHYDSGDWRIGDLSVSRSFGDLDNVPHVTHVPESYLYQLQDNDGFIIIACDGVWDVLENHMAVNFVRDHINNNHVELYNVPNKYHANSSDNIARKLAEYAIAKGSTDNVSVFIVIL